MNLFPLVQEAAEKPVKVKSSLLRTWLCHSMLVVFDLGMDLVEVGVGSVLPSRDLDRDKPLFREVVPQDVGRIRETLQNKNGNTYCYSFQAKALSRIFRKLLIPRKVFETKL